MLLVHETVLRIRARNPAQIQRTKPKITYYSFDPAQIPHANILSRFPTSSSSSREIIKIKFINPTHKTEAKHDTTKPDLGFMEDV
jgi:hypothetical protein